MINSIELQAISKILHTDEDYELERLCSYDSSYYAVFNKEIEFILDHLDKYGNPPDPFTFQAEFPTIEILQVTEPLEFLEDELKKNKQVILLRETFNKLSDLGSGDIEDAWEYLNRQCELASELDSSKPLDIVKDADVRAEQIIEFNKQQRIPTGFKEIDEIMYGGLSTVEELLVLVARTNSGKSWVCTKLIESAQLNGFQSLYYSPEMQSAFIGARFDTWRAHFKNSDLYRGQYSDEYKEYLSTIKQAEIGALVVEDSDMSGGRTTVRALENLVKRYNVRLLVIDGLSYIAAEGHYQNESLKYKEICNDLFRLSKVYGCAVVIATQANRETRENRDESGEPFPNLYNIEGSDHPARIATQVFALRQLYEQHIMELRLEKSRNAKNEKPLFRYIVDFNTGSLEYTEDLENSPMDSGEDFQTPIVSSSVTTHIDTPSLDDYEDGDDDFDDVEF